jgi:hypothetical protein
MKTQLVIRTMYRSYESVQTPSIITACVTHPVQQSHRPYNFTLLLVKRHQRSCSCYRYLSMNVITSTLTGSEYRSTDLRFTHVRDIMRRS